MQIKDETHTINTHTFVTKTKSPLLCFIRLPAVQTVVQGSH